MLYEIHMIKNFPPTNLNRDDMGSPKTCIFGGVTRGRYSSQCLKRAWRKSDVFCNWFNEGELGIRTRLLPELVAERLIEMGETQEYVEYIKHELTKLGKKESKKDKKSDETTSNADAAQNDSDESEQKKCCTKQIVFYSPQDIVKVVNTIKKMLDECTSLNDVKKIKCKTIQEALDDANTRAVTLDIALFGRMVTSNAFRNVEAAMQVAHAVSTNKVVVESDYFTAMDDLLSGGNLNEMGAGMVGDVDYNSSCYYIYATVDTDILRKSMNDPENDNIIKKVIPALISTMAFSNPSGKQNSFAGHVLPSCMLVVCKEKKIPVSLVNAFVKPVKAESNSDLIAESIKKLAEETDMMDRSFELPVKARLWFNVDKYKIAPACATATFTKFQELVDAVAKQV